MFLKSTGIYVCVYSPEDMTAYLSTEQEVAELGEGEEHNEEHDGESSDVLGAL